MNSNDILNKIINAPTIENSYKINTIKEDNDTFYKEYFKEIAEETSPSNLNKNNSYTFSSFNEGGRRRKQHTAKFNTNIIKEEEHMSSNNPGVSKNKIFYLLFSLY